MDGFGAQIGKPLAEVFDTHEGSNDRPFSRRLQGSRTLTWCKVACMHPAPRLTENDVEFTAVRAQGAGGQNVNKVSSAAHLRFDIAASALPEAIKARLRLLGDQRISKDGVIVIKAQEFRSLDKNRAEALRRLQELVDSAAHVPKARRPTRPTHGAITRRLESKARRSAVKAARGRIE